MRRRRAWLAVAVAVAVGVCVATATGAAAQGKASRAHVHGAATLGIAIDDGTVTVVLEAPMEALVGFERRPRTPAERQALDALQATMRSPAALFRFDADAACTLSTSEVRSALLDAAAEPASGHADLDLAATFACARPDRLRTLEVGLFGAYRGLSRLVVEVAGPNGQLRRELRRPATTVRLTP